MTPQVAEEAQRLYRIARSDRAAFAHLIRAPDVRFANAAFQAQQAVEKAMKAVMILYGLSAGRTHNLIALAGSLADAGIDLPCLPEELAFLNPYATMFRYDDKDISVLTGDEVGSLVDRVLAWAKTKLAAAGVLGEHEGL